MIYKCDNCQHRNNCCENKDQYTALCKVVESVVKLDKEPEFHAWFSLTMKCDYFQADASTEMGNCEG